MATGRLGYYLRLTTPGNSSNVPVTISDCAQRGAALMPTMPPTHRAGPVRTKRERDQDHDRRRRSQKPWRAWYSLPIWRNQIRPRQLTDEPYCRRCNQRGEVVMATVVNHVDPHRGDWDRFIGGPFESLCKTCHDSEVQREERKSEY